MEPLSGFLGAVMLATLSFHARPLRPAALILALIVQLGSA